MTQQPRVGVIMGSDSDWSVMANVLGAAQTPTMTVDERLHHLFARMPDARVHLYGKGERPGRKVGHINFLGDHVAELANLRERAELAAHWLSHGQWTDGWDPHTDGRAGDDAERSDEEERRK